MSDPDPGRRAFGEGPLSRVAALVYNLLVIELLLLLATAPGLAGSLLIVPDASDAPLIALCALPLGPALSAALYALHHRRRALTDLSPAAAFWRGYRANLRGALQVWAPWLGFETIVAVNLTHPAVAGIPRWWATLLVLIAVAAAVWAVEALTITSLLSFRARDVARLAAFSLARHPGVTLATTCLLVATAAILLASEAALALLGSVLALVLVRVCRPVIEEIQRELTT